MRLRTLTVRLTQLLPVLTATLVASCASPAAPEQPLTSGVAIAVAPPTKLAMLVSSPPYRWSASWTVNVTVPGGPSRAGIVRVSVVARVERQGSLLVELAETTLKGLPPCEPAGT